MEQAEKDYNIHVLKKLSRSIIHVQQNIAKARSDLEKAQLDLIMDRMNNHMIEEVKKCTENIIRWNEIEEAMLK